MQRNGTILERFLFIATYREHIEDYFAMRPTSWKAYSVLSKDVKKFLGEKYDKPEYTWFLYDTIRSLEESRNEPT